MSTKDSAVTVN